MKVTIDSTNLEFRDLQVGDIFTYPDTGNDGYIRIKAGYEAQYVLYCPNGTNRVEQITNGKQKVVRLRFVDVTLGERR